MNYFIGILGLLILFSCGGKQSTAQTLENNKEIAVKGLINKNGNTIETRFDPPSNCERTSITENSFQQYLRTLPVKEHGSIVKYYNGEKKTNRAVYHAVIDLPIGHKNLHQCADAVMRLRAEYLWKNKRYDEIHFNFTNGFQVDYTAWMQGKRMVVNGNKTYWNNRDQPSNTYDDWWEYMELIFTYAGTLSLEKELKAVTKNNMKIGDVFIIGGSPGHAVIIVDMCENKITNEKFFMLAQSYMPAQEIQVLQNPANSVLSPWYSLKTATAFETPEWNFDFTHLKQF